MMQGTLLVSTREEEDDMFGQSVVLIFRHSPNSTEGIILNKPFNPNVFKTLYPNGTDANSLARTLAGNEPNLMLGGPVSLSIERHRTRVLTRKRPDHDSSALEVVEGVFLCRPRTAPGRESNESSGASPESEHLGSLADEDADDRYLLMGMNTTFKTCSVKHCKSVPCLVRLLLETHTENKTKMLITPV
jgi:hypothetical protein